MRHVIEHALAVVVRTTDDRFRRRIYLSLSAAEKAATRAREAGHQAEVILTELHAVATLPEASEGLREAA